MPSLLVAPLSGHDESRPYGMCHHRLLEKLIIMPSLLVVSLPGRDESRPYDTKSERGMSIGHLFSSIRIWA
jgi:hypothetical protein